MWEWPNIQISWHVIEYTLCLISTEQYTRCKSAAFQTLTMEIHSLKMHSILLVRFEFFRFTFGNNGTNIQFET